MKQLSFCVCICFVLVACNTGSGSSGTSKDAATATDTTGSTRISYPYNIGYASDYSIGDPKHAQTVLSIWKDYDNNTLDAHKDAFADSLQFVTMDGSLMAGPKDSVIKAMASYRSSLANVTETVDAVVSLQPKGKEESWVSVWGKEIDTHKDNKVDSVSLHEDWMFDKNGKIIWVQQYMRAFPKKK